MGIVAFLGRLCFVSLFIASGVMKLQQFDLNESGGAILETVKPKLDTALDTILTKLSFLSVSVEVAQSFYPVLLLTAISLEILGSVLFLIGNFWGPYVLALFVLPTTLIMHDFWNIDDQDKAQLELVQFMKNVVIIGALIIVAGTPRR